MSKVQLDEEELEEDDPLVLAIAVVVVVVAVAVVVVVAVYYYTRSHVQAVVRGRERAQGPVRAHMGGVARCGTLPV